jgi:hypothetical protein
MGMRQRQEEGDSSRQLKLHQSTKGGEYMQVRAA